MRIVLLFLTVFLYSSFSRSQNVLIAHQGFEVSGSSWEPLSHSTPPCSSGDDLWDVTGSLGIITPSEGSSFWGVQDLNGDCGSSGFEWIELPEVDISGFRSVAFRLDLQVVGFDSGDDIELEPWFDGVAKERIVLIDGASNFSTEGWTEVEFLIPDSVSGFGLRIYVKQNGSDQAGFDNIRLEGLPLLPCSELLISEYVEGTSSTSHRNNFIEIYNASPEVVSLADYELVKYTGSNLEPSSPLALEGVLGPNETFLIEDERENQGVASDLSTSSSVLDFNGDDKIALRKDSVLIDVIGVIGDSIDFGKDVVLRRKSPVQNPGREFNLEQWDVYELEDTGDLGRHQSSCSGPSPEITIFGNGLEVPDGKSRTKSSDNTYFGYLDVDSSTAIENSFVIVNQGTANLEISKIEILGEHSSDFSLGASSPSLLEPTDSLEVTVTFSPSAPGVINAFLRVQNNDPSEPEYQFLLQGEGTSYTSSPLMISTYYEGEGNNRWIEVTNIGGEPTSGDSYYLVLFRQDLLDGPIGQRPSVKRAIPVLAPGESLKFRASLNVSEPSYALDGTEIPSGVCGFNGDDVLVISTASDETCWENRLDIIGKKGPWGQDIAYVRKFGCEQERPHSGFHPEHWYPFGPNEIDNAEPGNSQRLGEYYVGETVFENGTWTNGLPSLYRSAKIEEDFNTEIDGELRACNLEISEGARLLVESGDHIVIRNDLLVNGTLEIMNQGELLMLENFGQVTNNGDIRIHRWSAPLSPFDYTYWSSPVRTADLGETFQGSNPNSFYSFSAELFSDEDQDGQDDDGDAWVTESGMMIPGKGYAIMAPEALPVDNVHKVTFNGAPNNGIIEIPVALQATQNSENDWNLIGNPYPCTLDAEALVMEASNVGLLSGTFYFWTHNTPLGVDPDTGQQQYSSSDYAIYSIGMGGVQASSGGPVPNGNIASGQSFFTEALSPGILTFSNEMRRVGLPSHFYKKSRSKDRSQEKKIWLNLTSEQGGFSQVLIGFKEGATKDFDSYYDARRLSANTHFELYSKLGSRKLAIRGEPPLQGNERIPLGIEVKNPVSTSLRLAIGHMTESIREQGIYLLDREKDILHNLKNGDYSFSTEGTGSLEGRFELQLHDGELSTDSEPDQPSLANRIIWSLTGGVLSVRTRENDEIVDLKLYDLLGRTVIASKPLQKNANLAAHKVSANAVYLLRVATRNGERLSARILHL